MGRRTNLKGQRFGKLTVIERADPPPMRSGYIRSTWRCVCDCGRERNVRGSYLLRGTAIHCGYCEPPLWLDKRRRICRHCEFSVDKGNGEWACTKGQDTSKVKKSCPEYWCNAVDKITGAQQREGRCIICGKPVYAHRYEAPIYCYEHRENAERDDKILDDMPKELMLDLIAGIFLRAREDYLFDSDGQRSDAEVFLRSAWAQSLSLSEFDADAVLKQLDEEMNHEAGAAEKHHSPTR